MKFSFVTHILFVLLFSCGAAHAMEKSTLEEEGEARAAPAAPVPTPDEREQIEACLNASLEENRGKSKKLLDKIKSKNKQTRSVVLSDFCKFYEKVFHTPPGSTSMGSRIAIDLEAARTWVVKRFATGQHPPYISEPMGVKLIKYCLQKLNSLPDLTKTMLTVCFVYAAESKKKQETNRPWSLDTYVDIVRHMACDVFRNSDGYCAYAGLLGRLDRVEDAMGVYKLSKEPKVQVQFARYLAEQAMEGQRKDYCQKARKLLRPLVAMQANPDIKEQLVRAVMDVGVAFERMACFEKAAEVYESLDNPFTHLLRCRLFVQSTLFPTLDFERRMEVVKEHYLKARQQGLSLQELKDPEAYGELCIRLADLYAEGILGEGMSSKDRLTHIEELYSAPCTERFRLKSVDDYIATAVLGLCRTKDPYDQERCQRLHDECLKIVETRPDPTCATLAQLYFDGLVGNYSPDECLTRAEQWCSRIDTPSTRSLRADILAKRGNLREAIPLWEATDFRSARESVLKAFVKDSTLMSETTEDAREERIATLCAEADSPASWSILIEMSKERPSILRRVEAYFKEALAKGNPTALSALRVLRALAEGVQIIVDEENGLIKEVIPVKEQVTAGAEAAATVSVGEIAETSAVAACSAVREEALDTDESDEEETGAFNPLATAKRKAAGRTQRHYRRADDPEVRTRRSAYRTEQRAAGRGRLERDPEQAPIARARAIHFEGRAQADLDFVHGSQQLTNRLKLLMDDILASGRRGKPETLSNGRLSRRMTDGDRLVYTFSEGVLTIYSILGHYPEDR